MHNMIDTEELESLRRDRKYAILSKLAHGAAVVLLGYTVLKGVDFALGGDMHHTIGTGINYAMESLRNTGNIALQFNRDVFGSILATGLLAGGVKILSDMKNEFNEEYQRAKCIGGVQPEFSDKHSHAASRLALRP